MAQVIDWPKDLPKLPKLGARAPLLFVIALGLMLLFTSFYTVEPEEVGVVMRFGRYITKTDPGLHLKIPLGIDRVIRVPVQRQLKEEFGFRTVTAGVRSQFRGAPDEALMLTGDLNAAVVEWVVQYRIVDPERYLFRVRNVEDTLRDLSEAVMREVVGDRTVNEVVTIGRQEIADLVEQRLQAACDQYETGIKIDQVVLQDVNPPDEVKASFNEVNEAEQERETLINQAQEAYNKRIPNARGQAQKAIEVARGYALDRVNRAKGEAARFNDLYSAYARAPEVTRKRMYLETMGKVIPEAGNKVVIDDDLKGILPLLNLGSGALGGGSQ